jgi:hypothetical protein
MDNINLESLSHTTSIDKRRTKATLVLLWVKTQRCSTQHEAFLYTTLLDSWPYIQPSPLWKRILCYIHRTMQAGVDWGHNRKEPNCAEVLGAGWSWEDQYVGWLVRCSATRAKTQATKNWTTAALPRTWRTRSQDGRRPAAIRGAQNQHRTCQSNI